MFGINTVVNCAVCGGPIVIVGMFAVCSECGLYVDPDSGEPYTTDTSESEVADEFDDVESVAPIDEFYIAQEQ